MQRWSLHHWYTLLFNAAVRFSVIFISLKMQFISFAFLRPSIRRYYIYFVWNTQIIFLNVIFLWHVKFYNSNTYGNKWRRQKLQIRLSQNYDFVYKNLPKNEAELCSPWARIWIRNALSLHFLQLLLSFHLFTIIFYVDMLRFLILYCVPLKATVILRKKPKMAK